MVYHGIKELQGKLNKILTTQQANKNILLGLYSSEVGLWHFKKKK
jgi:hypothetical protein